MGLGLLAVTRVASRPDAAVDVVADPAGRDDPVWQAGRRHAADREAVALVHVRHHHNMAHQSGQAGGVHRLIDDLSPNASSSKASSAKMRTGTRMSWR